MRPEDDENIERLNAYIEFPLPAKPTFEEYPNGWMSRFDLSVIYNAARRAKGDILEVGPWLGRSSTAIALGLRDRQEVDEKPPVLYDVIDFGIAGAQEWQERWDEPLRLSHDKGKVAEAVLHPGGSNAVLVDNLRKLDLLRYTNVIMRGDLLTSPINKKYKMIFCDALHRPAEIDRTMPRLKSLVGAGCTLVADDVVTEEMAEQVASYLKVKEYFFTRTKDRVRRRKVCVFTCE